MLKKWFIADSGLSFKNSTDKHKPDKALMPELEILLVLITMRASFPSSSHAQSHEDGPAHELSPSVYGWRCDREEGKLVSCCVAVTLLGRQVAVFN